VKKKVGLFNRIIYGINIVVAFLLLISFTLPYIPPKSFPTISLLSLIVSPLIILNLLFVLYWLFKLKRKIVYSLIVLIIAHFQYGSFYQFSSKNIMSETKNSLKVLSFNVRLFNAYENDEKQLNVSNILSEIITQQQPELICIQEFYKNDKVDFSDYPYQYIHFKEKNKLGYAILSKHPLINKNSFNFSNTFNNSIYAEVIKNGDTLGIYNLHLQSIGIIPRVSYLQNTDKEAIIKRITKRFVKQQEQLEIILNHKSKNKKPILLCGDFNNSPYSYVYHEVSNTMKDAFFEKGKGLGTTYLFDSFPMRIDYIMVSEEVDIIDFKTIKKTFSDHYPVFAEIGW